VHSATNGASTPSGAEIAQATLEDQPTLDAVTGGPEVAPTTDPRPASASLHVDPSCTLPSPARAAGVNFLLRSSRLTACVQSHAAPARRGLRLVMRC